MRRRAGIFFTTALVLFVVGQASVLCAQEQKSHDNDSPRGDDREAATEQSSEGSKPFWESLPFDLHGFWEFRGGLRTQQDTYQSKDATLGETRLQVELSKTLDWGQFRVKTDFLYDGVLEEVDVDLREASVLLTPFEFMDLKVGRQILTWGTGDLLFINDLFPKDWNSFFIGRATPYLKAPSDAVKASFFTDLVNLDIVYSPRFDPDRFIDGRRISYWNSTLGRLAGRDAVVRTEKRDHWFDDYELAWRFSKNIEGYGLAAYGYWGFWKSPAGLDAVTGRATFPELSVYGASLRGAFLKGIGNIEFGYYDSRKDRNGDNPFVRNSELRVLAGYEQEVARDFTVGVQYYLEHIMDYGDYKRTLPSGSKARDEDRHVITLRLTKLLMNQNLELSLFVYYSPSDSDAYLRPRVHYKINDNWSTEVGANIFLGEDKHTFFGQFENNSNIYFGLRRSF